MNIALNRLALLAFFVLNLWIGLRGRRGIATLDDYLGRQKNLGLGVLMATLFATLFDAGNIGLKVGYSRGLINMLNPLLFSMTSLGVGHFLLSRLAAFKEHTMAGVITQIYGKGAGIVSIVISTIYSFLVIIAQVVAMAGLADMVGFSKEGMILGVGFLVTLYTALGGVRAVVVTDLIQVGIMIGGILIFFFFVVYGMGGVKSILGNVNSREFTDFFSHKDFSIWLPSAFFWSVFPTLLISPPIIQRCLMTQEKKDIQQMFLYFSAIYPLLRLLIAIVALGRFSLPNTLLSIKGMPISYPITLLCENPMAQMVFMLAACAIFISTMDSFLSALSINIIYGAKGEIQAGDRKKMGQVRMISSGIGCFCTLMALFILRQESLSIIGYGNILLSPLALPLLLGLYGYKGKGSIFWATLGTFFFLLFTLYGLYMLDFSLAIRIINSVYYRIFYRSSYFHGNQFLLLRAIWFIALPMSTLVFFLSHFILHGGAFVLVDLEKNQWKAHYRLTDFFGWLTAPLAYFEKKTKQYGTQPFLLGFFTLLYMLFPYISSTASNQGYLHLSILRIIPSFWPFF